MKESIANTWIFYIVLTFISLLIGALVTSISYSKAFKIKNRIIEMIENHTTYDSKLEEEIEKMLGTVGYRINTNSINNCPTRPNAVDATGKATGKAINQSSRYRYCIYKYNTQRGIYYGVTTYMYFDIPLVEGLVFPVYSETKTIFDLSIY